MSPSWNNLARTLARVAVGVLLLVWIFHVIFLQEAARSAIRDGVPWSDLSRWQQWRTAWHVGPPELWRTLSLVPAGPLAISVALMGGTLLLGVLRWLIVLRAQGLDLPAGRAFEIAFIAHFFNSFLLGSTGGDLMKAYYAARETRHRKTDSVVTVLVDRFIGLWSMLLFGSVMLLPNWELVANHERLRHLAIGILVLLAAGTLILLIAFYGGISKGWTGARTWLRRLPLGEWLERSLDSCRHFGRVPWFVLKTVSCSMALNLVCVAQMMVLSQGLGQSVPATAWLAIVPIVICVASIPITPSGLGVRENLFVFLLAVPALGVDPTAALSLSLLAYAGSLFWSLVGGLVYMGVKDRRRLRQTDLAMDASDPPGAA